MKSVIKYSGLISYLVLLGILMPGCGQVSDNNVTVSGTIVNLPETQLFIYQVLPAGKPLIDSVRTDAGGNFMIGFHVENPGFYLLQYTADDAITLVVTPGENITLKADGKSLRNTYTVGGSANSELYAAYNNFTAINLRKVDSLSAVFAESRNEPDFQSVKNRLDESYMDIFDKQKEDVISFVNEHLNSLASLLVILNNFGPNPLLSEKTHPGLFLKLDSALILRYPENSMVNTFHLRMLSFKAGMAEAAAHDRLLKPGMPAPEIVLPDASGKETRLSSLKGKLTLVYFWNSWNALSRQNNINLTTVYNKYHGKGFEIYAVSLDSDTELWKKACLIDKAYWVNVNDTKGLASEFSKTYGVKALPSMILIGKDGNIISREPQLTDLENLLKEKVK